MSTWAQALCRLREAALLRGFVLGALRTNDEARSGRSTLHAQFVLRACLSLCLIVGAREAHAQYALLEAAAFGTRADVEAAIEQAGGPGTTIDAAECWSLSSSAVDEPCMLLMARVFGPSRPQVLHIAASENRDVDAVRALVEAGAPVDGTDDRGWTPLMYAARANTSAAMTRMLLGLGADPDRRSSTNMLTALHVAAAWNPNTMVVTELLGAGAQVDARDNWGATPLMWAAERGQRPQVVRTLLAGGANPNARDSEGTTPLMRSTWHPDIRVMTVLIGGRCGPQCERQFGEKCPYVRRTSPGAPCGQVPP